MLPFLKILKVGVWVGRVFQLIKCDWQPTRQYAQQ